MRQFHTGNPTFTWRASRSTVLCYILVVFALWQVPVFQVLHVESAAVIAFVAFFASGSQAISAFSREESPLQVLKRHLMLLLVPLALLSVSALWAPNKGYLWGLLFFLLFPVVTVAFAVGMSYLLTARRFAAKIWLLWLIGLVLTIVGVLYDIGLHPQFFTYNHVFGAILGPIYDQELYISPGLLVFRGLSICWALLFLIVGGVLRGERTSNKSLLAAASIAVLVIVSYTNAENLGLNTTHRRIVSSLDGTLSTPHFEIHYQSGTLSGTQLRRMAREHEYHWHRLRQITDINPSERISSYLYPDGQVKAQLTGARRTNVAPVWLKTPQLHITARSFEHSFPHELAHVFARDAGWPVIHASPHIGLVEGWAVALEPADGMPPPDVQVAAAVSLADSIGYSSANRLAEGIAGSLSALSFWSGRSIVSYTTMGSFVGYLLNTRGTAAFLSVYGGEKWERAYGRPIAESAADWSKMIQAISPDASTIRIVRESFLKPSLFETPSPHHVPTHVRLHRRGQARLASGDTTGAVESWEQALALEPGDPSLLDSWALLQLSQGNFEDAVDRIQPLNDKELPAVLLLRLADAHVCVGDTSIAMAEYRAVYEKATEYDRDFRGHVALRQLLMASGVEVCSSYRTTSTQESADWWLYHPATGDAVDLARSLALARAERFDDAIMLAPDCADLSPQTLAFQCHTWLADIATEAGDLSRGQAELAAASGLATAVGDGAGIAWMKAKMEQLNWIATSYSAYSNEIQ